MALNRRAPPEQPMLSLSASVRDPSSSSSVQSLDWISTFETFPTKSGPLPEVRVLEEPEEDSDLRRSGRTELPLDQSGSVKKRIETVWLFVLFEINLIKRQKKMAS